MSELVGVLALQGAFDKHIEMLRAMNVDCQRVRTASELDKCDALIIPGGESTTMSLLIQKFDLYDDLRAFAANKPVMGVCAGAILMADEVNDSKVVSLQIMPMTAVRNSYGRQVSSFSAYLKLHCDNGDEVYPAHFIRAPKLQPRSDDIEVLSQYNDDAVMLKMGRHMALSFHPELTHDNRVHACWLKGFHSLFV
ncbi:pyridoxal 5'-phosphate synthase glutaminase subunit PdxT [Pseudomonadota bacterium]